jgi:hypothetical protein
MSGARGLIVTTCAVLSALGLLALVAMHVLIWTDSRKEPRYEYKVLAVQSEGLDRTGDAAMKFSSITPSEKELSKLGDAGWEVVGTYLEMETAYPNFGKAEYVTGLQPNVRPQRLVMIMRHRFA